MSKRKDRVSREPLVREVARILDLGEPTRFALEGAVRAGLRSHLVLDGRWQWQRADDRAALIIELAFARLGVSRPTWAQGQPEAPEGRPDNYFCRNCGRPIGGSRWRFCSTQCSGAAQERKRNAARADEADALAAAYAAAKSNGDTRRSCAHCGSAFELNRELGKAALRQKYCSRKCALDAMRGRRTRSCATCGRPFHARKATSRFCSVKCMYGNRRCDETWTPARRESHDELRLAPRADWRT